MGKWSCVSVHISTVSLTPYLSDANYCSLSLYVAEEKSQTRHTSTVMRSLLFVRGKPGDEIQAGIRATLTTLQLSIFNVVTPRSICPKPPGLQGVSTCIFGARASVSVYLQQCEPHSGCNNLELKYLPCGMNTMNMCRE